VNVPATLTAASENVQGRVARRWLAPVVYGAVLAGSAFAGYWAMFSEFAPYDDSGWFINSIRLFNEGHALYDHVFTYYGPFSFELWRGVFLLAGHGVTTDSGRLAIVVLWLFTSLLIGVSCQRLTGRLSIGVIAQVLSFNLLTVLNKEPMHASGVVSALLAISVAIISLLQAGRVPWGLIALGALVAAAVLTKINVGGFYAIAVLYALVMTWPSLRRLLALRWLVALCLVGVGPVLMLRNLSHQWTQDYAILAAASALAVVLMTSAAADADAGGAQEALRWARWLLAGFVGCAVVLIAVVLALGSSPGALFESIIIVPTRQASVFTAPAALSRAVVVWAAIWLVAAWLVRRLWASSRLGVSRPEPLGALGRILAAVAIWLSTVTSDPLQIALPLLWISAIPSTRDDGSAHVRFVRILIPVLAVLQGLQAYPVAGAQTKVGSLMFIVCGAVCFADGWSDLEAWRARSGVEGLRSLRTLMGVLAAVLAAALVLAYVARPAKNWSDTYSANRRLPIAGASYLRLPAPQVVTFTRITNLLRARCHSVISLPGLLSFNLWSGLPGPSGLVGEAFWHEMSATQQLEALAAAKATPGLCLVRNDYLAAKWGRGTPPPQVPLVVYMKRDFVPIARYEGYVVAVRRS
jgi:hypothetical protein